MNALPGQAVGRQADKLKILASCHLAREGFNAVPGQHQLLHLVAVADLGGQLLDLIVREDEPAEVWGQGLGGDNFEPAAAERQHAQRRAASESLGQSHKIVVGQEQDLELLELGHVVGQRRYRVSLEVEHLERVCQVKHLLGYLAELRPGQIQLLRARQLSRPEVFHGRCRALFQDRTLRSYNLAPFARCTRQLAAGNEQTTTHGQAQRDRPSHLGEMA